MRELELPDVQDVMLEYRKIKLLYRSALKEIRTKLEILNDEFRLVHQYNPIEHIESRLTLFAVSILTLMKASLVS